jgi:hypothetical protein
VSPALSAALARAETVLTRTEPSLATPTPGRAAPIPGRVSTTRRIARVAGGVSWTLESLRRKKRDAR